MRDSESVRLRLHTGKPSPVCVVWQKWEDKEGPGYYKRAWSLYNGTRIEIENSDDFQEVLFRLVMLRVSFTSFVVEEDSLKRIHFSDFGAALQAFINRTVGR